MKSEFAKANGMIVFFIAVLITALIIGGFNSVIKNQEARAASAIAKAVAGMKNFRTAEPAVVKAKRVG